MPRQGSQRWRVLLALRDWALTAEQVAAKTGIAYVSVSTRISELKRDGWVYPDGVRRTGSGSHADVLHLTERARRELDREQVAA